MSENECRNCRYFKPLAGQNLCMFAPPVPMNHPIWNLIGVRPTTAPDDFCSEFVSREEGS